MGWWVLLWWTWSTWGSLAFGDWSCSSEPCATIGGNGWHRDLDDFIIVSFHCPIPPSAFTLSSVTYYSFQSHSLHFGDLHHFPCTSIHHSATTRFTCWLRTVNISVKRRWYAPVAPGDVICQFRHFGSHSAPFRCPTSYGGLYSVFLIRDPYFRSSPHIYDVALPRKTAETIMWRHHHFPRHHSDCTTVWTTWLSVDHVGIQIRLYFLFLSDIIILYVLFPKLSMDIPRALVVTIIWHFLYFPILSFLCYFLLSTSFLA